MTFKFLKEYVKYNLGSLALLDDSEKFNMILDEIISYVYKDSRKTAKRKNGKHCLIRRSKR